MIKFFHKKQNFSTTAENWCKLGAISFAGTKRHKCLVGWPLISSLIQSWAFFKLFFILFVFLLEICEPNITQTLFLWIRILGKIIYMQIPLLLHLTWLRIFLIYSIFIQNLLSLTPTLYIIVFIIENIKIFFRLEYKLRNYE